MPVVGTDGGREFTRVLIGNELTMDVAAAEQDILDAGEELVRKHSGHRCHSARVHEYGTLRARVLRDRLGVPVYDIYSFMLWFHAGLAPRDFGHPGSIAGPWRER